MLTVVTPLPCKAPTALPRHALTRGFLPCDQSRRITSLFDPQSRGSE